MSLAKTRRFDVVPTGGGRVDPTSTQGPVQCKFVDYNRFFAHASMTNPHHTRLLPL